MATSSQCIQGSKSKTKRLNKQAKLTRLQSKVHDAQQQRFVANKSLSIWKEKAQDYRRYRINSYMY